MTSNTETALRYIGDKTRKTDNVSGLNPPLAVVWDGYGDVQNVPTNVASRFLAHASVWEEARLPARPRPKRVSEETAAALAAVEPIVPQLEEGATEVADIILPEVVLTHYMLMLLKKQDPPMDVAFWNKLPHEARAKAVRDLVADMRQIAAAWAVKQAPRPAAAEKPVAVPQVVEADKPEVVPPPKPAQAEQKQQAPRQRAQASSLE